MANLETSSDASIANQTYAATDNAAEAPKTNNLTDLAQDLMSSHAHRPGLVQEDLAKATEALHANGSLANLSIIGLDGKDLIARDDQGQTLLLDANNPENQQVLAADLVSQPIGTNGRTAELAADGSGKYTVVSGDSCWRIANDILTNQGVEQPTDNQIANYIKELETSNGRSFAQLQVGDEINIPTKLQGGESSHFAAPETPGTTNTDATNTDIPATPDATDTTNPDTVLPADSSIPDTTVPTDTTVPALSPEAAKQMEMEKFGIDTSYALMAEGFTRATEHFTPRGTYSKPSATLNDINSTLNRNDLTDNERLGLQMMQSQYDYLKSSEDGNIHAGDLDRGKAQRYQEIEANYAQPNSEVSTEVNPYDGIFPAASDATNTIPAAPEVTPQTDLAAAQDQINSSFEMIGSAYLKAVQHETMDGSYSSASISHDDVVTALGRTDLTASEQQGLQILDQNFDAFKNPETGVISNSDLLQAREILMQDAVDRLSLPAVDSIQVVPELPTEVPTELPAEAQPAALVAPFFNTSSIYEDEDLMAA